MLSAGVPLIFAGYLASVPACSAHAALLLGFLLIVDAGLLAISIARGEALLPRGRRSDGAGRARRVAGDVVVCAGRGLDRGARLHCRIRGAVSRSASAGALVRATVLERPGATGSCRLALVLFVFPVLAAIEAGVHAPVPLFGTLLALVGLYGLAGGSGVGRHAVLRRGLFLRLQRKRSGRPSTSPRPGCGSPWRSTRSSGSSPWRRLCSRDGLADSSCPSGAAGSSC